MRAMRATPLTHVRRGRGGGVELAREWGNRPANHATPTLLADAAKGWPSTPASSARCMGPPEVAQLGMGAFMAVAQGSGEPLRFIELRYNGAAKTQAPMVLVGKGITFDTQAASPSSPRGEMDEMKFDMCGAASVLGVFRALAELQPAINVVGLIPACENMPDGRAIKPGDVVTSMSGQTIEILNTDAEGRLVLCDALTYAARFKPAAVIDIATLTGACVIALGGVRSGLFATAMTPWPTPCMRRAKPAHDLCWRMPLDDDYADGLKSQLCRRGQRGRSTRGLHHGGQVPAALCGRHSVGAPGHCWNRLERWRRQGCHWAPRGLAGALPAGAAATCNRHQSAQARAQAQGSASKPSRP